MNVTQISSYALNNQARRRSAAVRRAPPAPMSVTFETEIEDSLTEIVFVAMTLGLAALLRYGAPAFPGRDEAAAVLDFAAACGVVHSLIVIIKTCLFADCRQDRHGQSIAAVAVSRTSTVRLAPMKEV